MIGFVVSKERDDNSGRTLCPVRDDERLRLALFGIMSLLVVECVDVGMDVNVDVVAMRCNGGGNGVKRLFGRFAMHDIPRCASKRS